jgi:hypothetical protein
MEKGPGDAVRAPASFIYNPRTVTTVANHEAINKKRKYAPFVSGSVLMLLCAVATTSLAQEELSWWGYSVADDSTGELSYGVTKSIISTTGGEKSPELRVGFRCFNGKPLFTFEPGRYIAPSSTDFTLRIWVDDNPRLAMDMRVWSTATTGSFSTFPGSTSRLFSEMVAGYELRWQIDTAGLHDAGSLSLIGFTAASREFINYCPF